MFAIYLIFQGVLVELCSPIKDQELARVFFVANVLDNPASLNLVAALCCSIVFLNACAAAHEASEDKLPRQCTDRRCA